MSRYMEEKYLIQIKKLEEEITALKEAQKVSIKEIVKWSKEAGANAAEVSRLREALEKVLYWQSSLTLPESVRRQAEKALEEVSDES